jgi:adenylate cyclase
VVEIERKFLVSNLEECLGYSTTSIHIVQGYLSLDPSRTVRIRKTDTGAFLTIKGKSNKAGNTRFEWEKEISETEATELLSMCLGRTIKKTRHLVPFQSRCFEVDVFSENHRGLVIAEIELQSADEKILLPSWIGQEVTGDERYYNSFLAKKDLKP